MEAWTQWRKNKNGNLLATDHSNRNPQATELCKVMPGSRKGMSTETQQHREGEAGL